MGRSGRWFGNEPNAPTYVETAYKFTAVSDGQTDYGPLLYLPPYLDVFVDGIKLTRAGDVTYGTGAPAASTFSVSAEVAAKVKAGMVVEAIAKVPTRVMDALTQAIADSLYLKLSDIITPPQFDNDTSLATTAFVQRALGNFSGVRALSVGANTLSAADCGKVITHTSPAGVSTATLPLLSDMPAGGALLFKSTSPYNLTLSRSGADLISANGTSLTSVVVQTGDDLLLIKVSSGYWFATGSAVRGQEPGFGSYLAANGYQKLPSGLIIQWGVLSVDAGGVTVPYPIAFPSACYGVSITHNGAFPGSVVPVGAGAVGLTSFVACQSSGTPGVTWFAVGK